MVHFLASSGNRFLAGASYPDSKFDERDAERFFSSLGRSRSEIKEIKIFGPLDLHLNNDGMQIIRAAGTDYPPCLDGLFTLDLKPFKGGGEFRLPIKIDFLFRVVIYILIGYGVMLYLTVNNYDQKSEELRKKIRAMDAAANGAPGKIVDDYSDVIKEMNEKLSKRQSPLAEMEKIARALPQGSSIARVFLNENTLEISAVSKEPLSVVKSLGAMEGIKTARLKGPPIKDPTGSYIFVILIEFPENVSVKGPDTK
jgi:hypothetical protein